MERFGIIDIGSNSIRLVIYERTIHGAYRIIEQAKEAARLSERITDDGDLSDAHLDDICALLRHYAHMCKKYRTVRIRAVATAALRNATHGTRILQEMIGRTQLDIALLSGDAEAHIGFLGVINTMDVRDGFVVDLGGGSTEISLFHNRTCTDTVSLPLGAVNALRSFGRSDRTMGSEHIEALVHTLKTSMRAHTWMYDHPHLPCIGLGGTVRSVCKIDQRHHHYSLPHMHQYALSPADISYWLHHIQPLSIESRKRIDGLTKDRLDIILSGLVILHTVITETQSSQLIVSGAGLRDGLFYESVCPDAPPICDVLENSVSNVLKLYAPESEPHARHVHALGMRLFSALYSEHGLNDRMRNAFGAACMLYRIGIAIDFYNFEQHTQYLIAHARLDGLSHRELLLCAMIASYRNEKRAKTCYAQHKDILSSADIPLVNRLGTLLLLASALDRSKTQPVHTITASIVHRQLHLTLHTASPQMCALEQQQLQSHRKEFEKVWGLQLLVDVACADA
jgi:exopolyphosphatase/guanosine-5'-triphosphate,3'-diphosphate pyrophosphatase